MPPTTTQKQKDAFPNEDKYMQLQQQQENELNVLSREFTILDRDQQNAQHHSDLKLSRETKVYKIFRKEYQNLLTDLSVATSLSRKREDAKMFEEIDNCLSEYTMLTNTVQAEKTYLEEIEDQIKTASKSVQTLTKLNMVTGRQCEEQLQAARKTCDLLENRLETQIKKFNVICAKNRDSREEIDHLLWDRRNFMAMWDRLIEKLSVGKKIMLDLIEQASIAYDQREDWCNRLQVLRFKGHNEFVINIQDMRELKRRQDNLKKMENFFNTKGQRRVMRDLNYRRKIKRRELKEKLNLKLNTYKAMVEDIVNFAKEDKVDKIAINYYNQESRNFAQFQYINDIMEEMEVVNDQLGDLHSEIEQKRILHEERAAQQEHTLKSLETDLEGATENTLEAEGDLSSLDSKLGNMMEGISRLCKICNCNTAPILQLLDDNTTIKEYNILLYANILEKTVHDGLISAGYNDKMMADKRKTSGKGSEKIISTEEKISMQILPIEKIVKASPCVLCVEHQMVGDLVDTLQHVLSKKDAIRKLKQRLTLPEGVAAVHNISRCTLPKARQMLQKRYE